MTSCDCVCTHCYKDDPRIGHCHFCSWTPPVQFVSVGLAARLKRRDREPSSLWYWSGGVY